MRKQSKNQQELNEQLYILSNLYEEGKDFICRLQPLCNYQEKDSDKLYEVLRRMRDMAATLLQEKYWINEN